MALSTSFSTFLASSSTSNSSLRPQSISSRSFSSVSIPFSPTPLRLQHRFHHAVRVAVDDYSPSTSGGRNDNYNSGGGSNGNDNRGGDGGDGNLGRNREEALLALAEAERSPDSLPGDLATAVMAGRIPGSVVSRFLELEKSGVFRWLLQFEGFRERLLADDLFLAKLGMECGVRFFNKSFVQTAAEHESQKKSFSDELEIVFSEVVTDIILNSMVVYVSAPTVPLKPPLGAAAGPLAKFFSTCPTNAFQVAVAGTPYSLSHRIGAMGLTGAKLYFLGSAISLACTWMDSTRFNMRKATGESPADGIENAPIWSTSGLDMATFNNIRYQVLAGVEHRVIEPLLRGDPLALCVASLAVRVGNACSGSLMHPETKNTGKASRDAVVQATSPATVGTCNAGIVPPSEILLGMDLNCDWKEKKFGFRTIAFASFYYDLLRQKLNPPRAST